MKLTEQQITENLACYEQAMRTGSIQGIEIQTTNGRFENKTHDEFGYDIAYRRKPQSKLSPFDAETWPLDAEWVRCKDKILKGHLPSRPLDILSSGIQTKVGIIGWQHLFEAYELTRDSGKTWEPCGYLSK